MKKFKEPLANQTITLLVWIGVIVTVCLGIYYRLIWLEQIPGVNGDESWHVVTLHNYFSGKNNNLRSPTNNILDPFFLLATYLFHLYLPVSNLVVRLPSALTSLLYSSVGYYLLRKRFNHATGIIFLLLSLSLPTNIIYARFGWNTSQTPMVTLLVIWFLWQKQHLRLIFVFAASLLIHPTNVTLLPAICLIIGYNLLTKKITQSSAYSTISLLLLTTLILLSQNVGISNSIPSLHTQIIRLFSLNGWLGYALGILRVFWGTTSLAFIVGSIDKVKHYYDLVLIASTLLLSLALISKRWPKHVYLLIVIIGTGVAFAYVTTGFRGLLPGSERYSLWFISPALLLLSLCLGHAFTHYNRLVSTTVVVVLVTAGLGTIQKYYFDYFLRTGGTADKTFQTNQVEPKRQVYNWIEANRESQTQVLVENWWLYWPLAHLYIHDPNTLVILNPKETIDASLIESTLAAKGYLVGYPNELYNEYFDNHSEFNLNTKSIKNYGGADVIYIWHNASML